MFRLLISLLLIAGYLGGCAPRISLEREQGNPGGRAFYRQAAAMNWKERDSLALAWVRKGWLPRFMLKLRPVTARIYDPALGHKRTVRFWISRDYFSLGTNKDWVRVPITPMAFERMSNQLKSRLPSPAMVDLIYAAARVKAEPVPLFAFRDSTPTMWHHHLLIEGQRMKRPGLIAGIKKDVVFSARLGEPGRENRVAIYGWHRLDGKPIQPLYTGHVNWYVDYSHGLRLVWHRVKVDGRRLELDSLRSRPEQQAFFSQ